MTSTDRPPDAALVERSFSLVNEAMSTVVLQRRRLQSEEPEDDIFVFRRWADWQFLTVSLRRLRRAAEICRDVAVLSVSMSIALAEFDQALPWLQVMRNVGEHVDEYALNSDDRNYGELRERRATVNGKQPPPTVVQARDLQVGSFDGSMFVWLRERDGTPLRIDAEDAVAAALGLFMAVRDAKDGFSRPGLAT